MKTIILIFILNTSVWAAREMQIIQAYEFNDTPSGEVGVSLSLTNVSSVAQTVRWTGGFYANGRPLNIPAKGYHSSLPPAKRCDYHSAPNAINNKATTLPQNLGAIIQPGGYVTLWCETKAGHDSDQAGGEGVFILNLSIDQDRGAIMGSGTIHVYDRTPGSNPSKARPRGWGDLGSGNFTINGGRAF